MNKKFSTLAASLMLASVFSANAQVSLSTLGGITDSEGSISANSYYHLSAEGTTGLAVRPNYNHTADSLVYVKLTEIDRVATEVEEDEDSHDDDVNRAYGINATLWSIESKSEGSASQVAVFKFKNKATGNYLSLKKVGNTYKPVMTGEEAEWKWSKAKAGSTISHDVNKVTITPADAKNNVTVNAEDEEGVVFKAYKPAEYLLSAADLNALYGHSFELAFAGDVEPNLFTQSGRFKAIEVDEAGADKGVHLQILNHAGINQKDADGVVTGVNKNVFLKVDTARWGKSGLESYEKGYGYKFAADTAGCGTDNKPVFKVADGELPAKYKDAGMGSYAFKFILNPGVANEIGSMRIVTTSINPVSTNHNYFENSETVTETEVAWLTFASAKVLGTSTQKNTRPVVTFKAGIKAVIDHTSAYIVKDARQFMKQISTEGKDRWIASANYGKEFVYLPCADAGVYSQEGKASELVPATQWIFVPKANGTYQMLNRATGQSLDAPKIDRYGNGKEVAATKIVGAQSFYTVEGRENVYATLGGDTIEIVPVANKSKFIGYKNYSNEDPRSLRLGVRVVSENLGDDIFVVEGADKALTIKSGVSTDNGAVMFEAEEISANNIVGYGKYAKVTGDSLTYSLYALKSANGYFSLYGNKADLKGKTIFAFAETGNEGEFNFEVAEKLSYKLDLPAGMSLIDGEGTDPFNVEYLVNTDNNEIVKNIEGEAPYYEVIEVKEGASVIAHKVVLTAAGKALLKEDNIVNNRYPLYERITSDTKKMAATVTGTSLVQVDVCDAQGRDRFALEAFDKARYATLETPAHQVITTIADDNKGLTMDGNGFASLLRADQDLIAGTPVTEENLGLWVDTACMKDEFMPMYYVATARGLSKEAQAAGEKYYLVSFRDSADAKRYTVVNNAKVTRLGFTKGSVVGVDSLAFGPAKADTVTVAQGKAAFAFQFTDTDGAYKIELPYLTNKIEDYKDEWGVMHYKEVPAAARFMAVNNNVLYLTNEAGAYEFTVTPTSKAPVANEGAEVNTVKVTADNGVVSVLNAAGKKVTISTVLGKIVANAVAASDNATFSVASGIVYVSVEGEEAVSVIVK